MPRAIDDHHSRAPGPVGDRILIVGAGVAAGWGVATHQSALPGTVSRALSALTGTGNVIDLAMRTDFTIEDVIDEIPGWELAEYDAIILCLGIEEAIRFRNVHDWRAQMRLLLSRIRFSSARRTQVVVVGIPPIRSTPFLDVTLGGLANRHAQAMNHESMALCAGDPDAHYVELSPIVAPQFASGWSWAEGKYADWGAELAQVLGGALASVRDSRGEVHPSARR